jgi:parallel beta-helix repeat protein
MLLAFGATIAYASAATPVYVNQTYTDRNAGKHTFGVDAFSTINDAISAVSVGGTVYVASGTYAEPVVIQKSLSLIGLGKATSLGASEDAPILLGGTSTIVITVTSPRLPVTVTLKNLHIVGGNYGIAVMQNANMTVDTNTIEEYGKNGVTFGPTKLPGFGGVRGTISNNIVTGIGPTDTVSQNGIQIAESNSATITGNSISKNMYSVPGPKWATGILIFRTQKVTISKNILNLNQAGINLSRASNNTVLRNVVYGDATSQAGIMISNGDETDIQATNNTISHNRFVGGDTGMWTTYTFGNSYTNNIVSNTTKHGFLAWDSDKNTIAQNTFSGIHSQNHDGVAIMLDGGDTTSGSIGSNDNSITSNTVTDTDTPLVQSKNSSSNNVLHNRF